jgi:hypothetical protein
MRNRAHVALTVFCALAAASYASAAFAGPTLDQSQTSADSADPFAFSANQSNLPVGQSFTAGISGMIDSVDMFGNGTIHGGTNSLTVELLAGKGTGGAILGTVTDQVNENAGNDEFSLSMASMLVQLVAGAQYTFLVTGVSGSGDLATRGVLFSDGNPYAGGQIVAGSGYGNQPNWDLAFQTFVDLAVPEPASWTLLVAALGISAAAHRRRQNRLARSNQA